MVNLRVLDLVKQAYTYEDGVVISDIVIRTFHENEKVTLSFYGIDAIPSSFANGCFVRVLESFGLQKIKENLSVIDSTKQINSMIKSRLVFESQRNDL
ncbi:STAS-like domain-containing protein [Chitinibacter bivalviorum]|uniref:STAS-like domain-containing protein n=1 Tax=Chitinibacter bivalviorum TaxID=2739434 RepID=A0A7H9BJY1_9NEIS|nr:STAS-like domain-containing protein [Chitinibacter bivalviorum]QLG88779.1 STAS-like domain-containing protein [Chitinibacter bivalviorum]